MNSTFSTSLRDRLEADWEQLSTQEMSRLDQLCDRFEAAFASSSRIAIESFTADLDEQSKRCVLPELILIEWQMRRSKGEAIDADDYKRRFPDYSTQIETAKHEFDAEVASPSSSWFHPTSGGEFASQSGVFLLNGASLSSGTLLGHYSIQSELGHGGMGRVYRVHDQRLHRDVAIKILNPDAARREHAKERFLREARAAAVVRHPHVVTIYSVEEFQGVPFLVMELVEGETLDVYLRRVGKLPAREAALIGAQIASGLAAAHQRGMIHRDVKPANILLDSAHPTHALDGSIAVPFTVKITDFGLARVTAELDLTNRDIIAGTPQFMSPEQARGDKADHRSDLFSLGTLLYTMLAGRVPFHGETVPGTMYKVMHDQPDSLTVHDSSVTDELNEIVMRLLSKSAEDRIQSASETAMRLRASVESSRSRDHGGLHRFPRRGLVIGTLFSALLLAILAVVFTIRTDNSEFTLITDDPDVSASIDKSGGLLVQDRTTKSEYRLKRGKNRLPHGDYDLQVIGPDNVELTTSTFTLKRGGEVKATVTVRRYSQPPGQDLWSEPVLLRGAINSEIGEQHPTITSDLLTLLFIRDGQIWQTDRESRDVDFNEPVRLPGEINDAQVDSPYVTGDGLTLCFASNRSGSRGMNDLWLTHRSSRSEPFSKPESIRGSINTALEESTPYISDDLLTLIYCAQPDEGKPVDLYRAERTAVDQPFGNSQRLGDALNGSRFDFFPRVASGANELFFTTNSFGRQEIRCAVWNAETKSFGNAISLPESIQSGVVGAPAISPDGRVLIFDAMREGGIGGFDLWITTKR